MKDKTRKRRKRRCFFRSLLITLCVLGTVAGLFWADYNTRLVANGTENWRFSSSYQDQTLTVQVWDNTQTVTISTEAEQTVSRLRDAIPAPLQIWGIFAGEIRRIFGTL